MNRTTWTERRALAFARGLYHVAASDGVDEAEAQALQAFLRQVGLATSVEELAHQPFDYAEASAALDSTWLRRTLVQACRRMAALDGTLTPGERDALRAMGAALGVGERLALGGLAVGPLADGPGRPDDLARWIGALEVDYVSWDDDSQHGYFWTFPHPAHPLREGAQVVVERGQALVVRHGELVADILGPGEHAVTPAALPGLAELLGWSGGPVVADLVFLRTGPSPRLRWGTSAPATVALAGHGPVDLRAYGRFSVRFHDPRQIIDRMARRVVPDDAEVEQRLRRIMAGRFATALASLTDLSLPLLNDLDALCTRIREALDEPLAQSGLFLARFDIENLTGPLELGLRPTSKRTQNLTHVARSLLGTTEQPMKTSELIACIRCGVSIPTAARFCTSCGTAQRKRCVSCGNALPAAARFCSHCGSGQPA